MKLENYLREVDERAGKATEGPWEHRSYPSGTEFIGMRDAKGVTVNLENFNPHEATGGYIGAHMTLYNVKAFGGESESDLELEKALNARFIAHSRTDVPKLIRLLRAAMEMRLQLRGCCDEFESTEKFDATVKEILGESK